METSVSTEPLLTREKLERFYSRLPWQKLPESNWPDMIKNVWTNGSYTGAVAHVVPWERLELLTLVANKKDQRRPDKKLGVGVPTEEIKGELPIIAAERAMNEELNLFKGFRIIPEPLTIQVDGRNVVHFVFRAELEEYTELPRIITDPDGEIEGGFLVNPFSAIRLKKVSGGYIPLIGNREVFYTHLCLVTLSLK